MSRPGPRPSSEDARRIAEPGPSLGRELRRHVHDRLGGVLPVDSAHGIDWYYDWVVLGSRSLEALSTIQRYRPAGDMPVIDVGCGLGTFVLLANASGMPAIGVEPEETEVELARKRLGEAGLDPALVRVGEGECLPFDDESASAVLLHDVLEHVRDWRAVLAEARRVLRPGGVVYAKGPSYTVRLIEPHYQVLWLPQMPKSLARRYLALRGRDIGYLEHIGYRRRGAVLAELRALGFELAFPRLDKLRDPESVNRPWARRVSRVALTAAPFVRRVAEAAAENRLQWAIDVVARVPTAAQ